MLKFIDIKNFGLIRDSFIEFDCDKSEIINIFAQYEDNDERSNRGGKSTLTDAFQYNRYGSCSKGKDASLIHNGSTEDMSITCGWTNDEEEIVIKRGISIKDKKMFLEVSGIEGEDKRKAQEYIDQWFGVNSKEFNLSSMISQGDINSFMDLSNPDKKKHILKWIDDINWVEFEKQAKGNLDLHTNALKDNNFRINLLKEKIIDEDDMKLQLRECGNNKNKIHKEIEDCQESRAVYIQKKSTIGDRSKLEDRSNSISNSINQKVSRIKSIEIKEKRKRELEIELAKSKNIEEEYNKVCDINNGIQKSIIETNTGIKHARTEFERIQGFKGICPITTNECNLIDSSTIKSQLQSKINISNKVAQDYKDDFAANAKSISRLESSIQNFKNLQMERAQIDVLIASKEELGMDLILLRKQLSDTKNDLSQLTDVNVDEINTQINQINDQIKTLQSQLKISLSKMADIKNSILEWKEAKVQIVTLEEDIKELTELESIWNYIKYMFSKNGLPSQIIESELESLDEDINYILSSIGLDMSCQFQLQREKKTWESFCLACNFKYPDNRKKECPECKCPRQREKTDDFQLKIFEQEKELSFTSDSGGGKVIVSFAIRIGLSRMMARKSGIHNNDILVLDEILAPLDVVNREAMIDVITNLLIEKLGYKQVFFISHTSLKDRFEKNLFVLRHSDYAEINWSN